MIEASWIQKNVKAETHQRTRTVFLIQSSKLSGRTIFSFVLFGGTFSVRRGALELSQFAPAGAITANRSGFPMSIAAVGHDSA
jgi:hypothetical protein